MIAVAAAIALCTLHRQKMTPVLWLDLKGNVLINGDPITPQIDEGVSPVKLTGGVGYDFSSGRGGILLGDPSALKLGGSLTISAWLYPRSYAVAAPQSEILFRGDDRNGLDPYCLELQQDGTIKFQIDDERNHAMRVSYEIELNRWTHVTASFNAKSGDMILYLNGKKVVTGRTSLRPFTDLDPGSAPGTSVGNVQSDHGPHNQPYNGIIADLRLYSVPLGPKEAGYDARWEAGKPSAKPSRTDI